MTTVNAYTSGWVMVTMTRTNRVYFHITSTYAEEMSEFLIFLKDLKSEYRSNGNQLRLNCSLTLDASQEEKLREFFAYGCL